MEIHHTNFINACYISYCEQSIRAGFLFFFHQNWTFSLILNFALSKLCSFASTFECNTHISNSNQGQMHATNFPPLFIYFMILHLF